MNFALIGAAGFIAPKHLKAIHDTGNRLVSAIDPHDCVGRLDANFPDAAFFTSIEQFESDLERRRLDPAGEAVDYVSVCSPNYLHDAHASLALRTGAHAICEKPLVISPGALDTLEELEARHGKRVYAVLQLRLLPSLITLRNQLLSAPAREKADVCLTYITRRGRWYDASWKGSPEHSGGVAMNIGIHFFDLLQWLFGSVEDSQVHLKQPRRMAGNLEFDRARVRWFLSTDAHDLPDKVLAAGGHAYRSMTFDGSELEFSDGFTELHTQIYREILAGRGPGIVDARPAITLAHQISHSEVRSADPDSHPLVRGTMVDSSVNHDTHTAA